MESLAGLADERGAVTILAGLVIPLVLVLFGVLAIDAGNWFVHKRHLQMQADAAALAGALSLRFPACDDDEIRSAALRYSGVGDGGLAYNDRYPSVAGDRLHVVLNGPDFHGQSAPGEADLAASPGPCDSMTVDVKMTETDLPWFFGTGVVEHINAQARVQLFKRASTDDALPLGVQEAMPRRVRAYIVDESSGSEVASVVLSAHGSSDGLARFDNRSDPLSFTPPAGVEDLGVRLAMTGATSTTCGEALVTCYDTLNPSQGLSYIRTYTEAGLPSVTGEPVARSVRLSPATCSSPSFGSGATCTADLVARVVWNAAVTAANTATRATLEAQYGGLEYPMAYNAVTGEWRATLSVASGTVGPRSADVAWSQTVGHVGGTGKQHECTTRKPCTGTFDDVQRTFWNDPGDQGSQAGPVAELDVINAADGAPVSDLPRCSVVRPACTVPLVFEVAIKGSLELDTASDPPRSLRVAGSGSQNQSLDCDPARGFVDEMAYGCGPTYAINTGTACSAPTTPPSCVPVETGTQANKPAQGLNIRFLCEPPGNPGDCGGSPGNWDGKPTTCPGTGEIGHNNWPEYPAGDPRLVPVLVVPFGTFEDAGNTLVPIIDIAAFYVTGYASSGAGFGNPCIADGDVFVAGTEDDNGAISGHFVKTVSPNTGGAGTESCESNDLGQCVAVLVK